ncbi:MAG: transcriptional repressor [Bacteroidales bacterium]|nr:transcriptional repressor [Bacteroidales bacterium]MDD4670784.1 transcriptional repressor [Bacteroidales bacterium]
MDIKRAIQNHGLKVTPQRRLVLSTMKELGHATIDELISRIQAKNPEVTISTIYRIIDSFCSSKLLSRFTQPDGKVMLDINTSEHIHIFNDNANVADYIDSDLIELIKQRLVRQIGKDEIIDKISVQIITINK